LLFWSLISNAAEIRRRISDPRSIRRMFLAAAAMALMMVAPIAGLRRYQTARVQALLADYAHDPVAEPRVAATKVSADTVRLDVEGPALSGLPAPIAVEMLAVRVGGAVVPCPGGTVDLVVRYLQRDNSSREDFSHVVRVPATAGAPAPSVAYIPVYVFAQNPYIRFAGIEVPSEQRACISGVSRLEGTDRTGLLLETVVAERSKPVPLYQRLSDDTEIAPPHIRSAIRRLSRIWRDER